VNNRENAAYDKKGSANPEERMVRLWANHASKFRSPLHPSRRIQTIRKKSKKADAAAAAKKRDKTKAEGRIALPLLFSLFSRMRQEFLIIKSALARKIER
jgi:hypothetical protein